MDYSAIFSDSETEKLQSSNPLLMRLAPAPAGHALPNQGAVLSLRFETIKNVSLRVLRLQATI